MYYRGLYNLTNLSTNILFSEIKYFPAFGTVMNRDIFKLLLSEVGFNDPRSTPERWESNQFLSFTEFLEKLNYHCSICLTPD